MQKKRRTLSVEGLRAVWLKKLEVTDSDYKAYTVKEIRTLEVLGLNGTKVKDLSPLKGLF